jgi:hypothetical protein
MREASSSANILGTKTFLYFRIPAEILLFVWALMLIILSGRRLISAFRHGDPNRNHLVA